MEDKTRLEMFVVLGVVTSIVCLLCSRAQSGTAGPHMMNLTGGPVTDALAAPTPMGGPDAQDEQDDGSRAPSYLNSNVPPFGKKAISYLPSASEPTTNSGASANFQAGYYLPVGG